MRHAMARGLRRGVAAAVLTVAAAAALCACGSPSSSGLAGAAGGAAGAGGPGSQAVSRTLSQADLDAEQAAVGDTWWRYLTGVRARDGQAAAATVSSGTLARYEHLRRVALTADRAALERLPVTDQLTVMVWRAVVPPDVLRTASPRDLVARSVVAGLNGDGSSTGLIDAIPAGDHAVGHYQRGLDGARATASFVREDGAWRLDLLPLVERTETASAQALQESGLPRDTWVTKALAGNLTPAQIAAAYTPPTPAAPLPQAAQD